jgi:MFS family permease
MALFGLLDLAIFNYPRWTIALWPAIALFFLVGIPGCVGYVAMLTLFQLQAPDRLRGRMYAVLSVGQATAGMLGAAVAGALGQRVSVLSLLTAQGAGYLLAALLLRLLAGRGPDSLAGPTARRQPLRRSTSPRRIAHDSSSSTLPGCGLRKRLTSIATSARSHRMR